MSDEQAEYENKYKFNIHMWYKHKKYTQIYRHNSIYQTPTLI